MIDRKARSKLRRPLTKLRGRAAANAGFLRHNCIRDQEPPSESGR